MRKRKINLFRNIQIKIYVLRLDDEGQKLLQEKLKHRVQFS